MSKPSVSTPVAWRSFAGGRLSRPGGAATVGPCTTLKEGAHGGTMGSPVMEQVEPRRQFIEENARDARFLDV
jgi:hypothetical protein